jgi:hypothetical protein
LGTKNAQTILQRKMAMGKMFLSLGFWMTIVLFVALGYAIDRAYGAECSDSMNCGYRHNTFASSHFSNENPHFENDLGTSDVARRRRCAPDATAPRNYPDFQQMANLQGGDAPTYAPGVSLTITRRPPEASLCPGPVEIPRH